jgi:two-component system response regulator AtoC
MSHTTILVVEDDELLKRHLLQVLKSADYLAEGVNNLAQARAYLQTYEPALIMLDARLPDGSGMELLSELNGGIPVILLTAYASVKEAVQAMQAGAAEYLVKPINLEELEITLKRVLENAALRQDYQFCKAQMKNRQAKKVMVGHSQAIQEVYRLIQAVGPTDVTVLIQGESGTGKELVAAEIHKHSRRLQRNFVALDCCTLQEKLFESELFGHEKGAFTGATVQKKGLIECAEDGSLFLDEIGEIELALQAKLLRVLETGHFRRLGGTKDLGANVRIVTATNRDLEEMSREGKFRLDLYYRLSSFAITLPALRDRIEDIPELVEHFIHNLHLARRGQKKSVTPEALRHLANYHWPGNIRELKNVIERALILSGESAWIGVEHLAFSTAFGKKSPPPRPSAGFSLNFEREPSLQEIEGHYLKVLLDKYQGHRASVAKTLGISERNTYRLLKKHGYN